MRAPPVAGTGLENNSRFWIRPVKPIFGLKRRRARRPLRKEARALRGRTGSKVLAQVVVDQLGHLEHRDGPLPSEDLPKDVVRVDVALLFLVLQSVALDVRPDLLHHLGPGQRPLADDLGEGWAGLKRLHECGIRLAGGLLAGLLRCLLGGHRELLLLERTSPAARKTARTLTEERRRSKALFPSE